MGEVHPDRVMGDQEREIFEHLTDMWKRYLSLPEEQRNGTFNEWENTLVDALINGCGFDFIAARGFSILAYEEANISTLDM